MIIALSSDHNGVGLKARIRAGLWPPDWTFVDIGPWGSESVSYQQYAEQVAEMIARGECDRGVLVCGTGVGMSIVANKVAGVRAALVHNLLTASKSREHNDANCLCIGAWVETDENNIGFVRAWLSGSFGEGRHVRRVEMIDRLPNRIVFANGVFDILHPGHIEMLRWAKGLGSWLVVGINSDASVRRLKGENRPINPELQRKTVLESLRFVDEVVIFDDDKATGLIEEIHPSIVVKGAEWSAAEIRERDLIPAWCDVKVFPMIDGHSTTRVIERASGLGYRTPQSVSFVDQTGKLKELLP